MAVNGGVIIAIGPTEDIKQSYVATVSTHNLDNQVLMPGFVNGHCHTPMTLLRSYVDNVELMDWLQKYIWPAEAQYVTEDFVRDGTELAVAEMIRSGCTTFLDMYFYPGTTADVVDRMGVRAGISVPVLQFPTMWSKDEEDALRRGALELLDRFANHPRVTPFLAPHAPYTVSDAGYKRVLQVAEERNLRIHTHLHETNFEVTSVPVRPMERLDALGLLGPKTVCAHMCHLTSEEIALAAKRGISVVHCACSNLKLASGLCPVKELLEAGVNVCLGTDGAGSNDDLDVKSEMKNAAFVSKLRAQSPVALSAVTLVEMATINGARAMGLESQIGSVEVGKQADLISILMRNAPVFNVHSSLVYVQTDVVSNVWVAGKQLLDQGRLVGVDEAALIEKGNAWVKKIIITTQPK